MIHNNRRRLGQHNSLSTFCRFNPKTGWVMMPSLVGATEISQEVSTFIIESLPEDWKGEYPIWCRQSASRRRWVRKFGRS